MALAALLLALIACVAGLFIAAATAYVLWQFCYKPWQVLRRDIVALNQARQVHEQAMKDLEEFVRGSRVQQLTDDELASREAAFRRRRAG